MRAPIRPVSDNRTSPGAFRARTARGVSFLEVVLGVILLGLVSGTFLHVIPWEVHSPAHPTSQIQFGLKPQRMGLG